MSSPKASTSNDKYEQGTSIMEPLRDIEVGIGPEPEQPEMEFSEMIVR